MEILISKMERENISSLKWDGKEIKIEEESGKFLLKKDFIENSETYLLLEHMEKRFRSNGCGSFEIRRPT